MAGRRAWTRRVAVFCAQKSLQEFRSEAAKYVSILVDMEGAYPTVEPFRDMTAGQDMQSMRGPGELRELPGQRGCCRP